MSSKEFLQGKEITIGILAHVDSGKTTLTEALLYESGYLKRIGRVDNQDTFLDTDAMEKKRGITIYAKSARLKGDNKSYVLLDTPGHEDFFGELEKSLWIMDYAILVINGASPHEARDRQLLRLLHKHKIPTFIFVNKMDQSYHSRSEILEHLQSRISDLFIDFSSEVDMELLATTSEHLLEVYLEEGSLSQDLIQEAFHQNLFCPTYFGSALKLDNVHKFWKEVNLWTREKLFPTEFGAKVYKIDYHPSGQRQVHLRITGGNLATKTLIDDEKINEIRKYSGIKSEQVQEVFAGEVATVIGLKNLKVGDTLGEEKSKLRWEETPLFSYQIETNEQNEQVLPLLHKIQEELGNIQVNFDSVYGKIQVKLRGEILKEVITSLVEEATGVHIEFCNREIIYREKIGHSTIGIGHFEPLRHYAEVHLRLESLPLGSGIVIENECSREDLNLSWQKTIMDYLEQLRFRGVLAGYELTDLKVTLIRGRGHQKHTQTNDFREATLRAFRQGLMNTTSHLLEPIYELEMMIPSQYFGKMISNLEFAKGEVVSSTQIDEAFLVKGKGPILTLIDFVENFRIDTKNEGSILVEFGGYQPCHNEMEVIANRGYHPDRDQDYPSSSIFCSHGAGYPVMWYQVYDKAHIKDDYFREEEKVVKHYGERKASGVIDQDEIEAIFQSTFYANQGKTKKRLHKPKTPKQVYKGQEKAYQSDLATYLLVDGYNMIYAWEELKEMAITNMDGARDILLDRLSNYQGYTKEEVLVIFDAYKTNQLKESIYRHGNLYVIYTKGAETADQYIEKAVEQIRPHYQVKVATSDAIEQLIIWAKGAIRYSAKEFESEVNHIAHIQMKAYDENKDMSQQRVGINLGDIMNQSIKGE